MHTPTRRTVLAAALGTALAGQTRPAYTSPRPAPGLALAADWQLRWSPEASEGGLGAFETIEDDRADSHPAGQPHILPPATTSGSTCTWSTGTPRPTGSGRR